MTRLFTALWLILLIPAVSSAWKAGDKIEVEWQGGWFAAKILKIQPNPSLFLIHYDGYDDSWDEWVPDSRIRPAGTTTSPEISDDTHPSAETPDSASGEKMFTGVETIWQACYSSDGKLILAASHAGNVKIIDATDFSIRTEWKIGESPVYTVDSTGNFVVVGSEDGTLQIRTFPEGRIHGTVKGFSTLRKAFWSPDGSFFVLTASPSENIDLNGVYLISTNGKILKTLIDPVPTADGFPTGIAFDRSGRRIAVSWANRRRGAEIYQTVDGTRLLQIKNSSDVNAIAIAPDGGSIYGACWDGSVSGWSASSGKPLFRSLWHETEGAVAITVSPDGRLIAVSGHGNGPMAKVYRTSDGSLQSCFGESNPVGNSIRFSTDGSRLLLGLSTYGNLLQVPIVISFDVK